MLYSNNYVLILLPFLLIFSSLSLCANEEENLMKQANDAYISKEIEKRSPSTDRLQTTEMKGHSVL